MATKTFPHAVIYNGVIIPANTPIEIVENEANDEAANEETAAETANDEAANDKTVKKPAKKAAKSDDNN